MNDAPRRHCPKGLLAALLLGAALIAVTGCNRQAADAATAVPVLTPEQTDAQKEAQKLARKRRLDAQEAEAHPKAAHNALLMIAIAWFGKISGH